MIPIDHIETRLSRWCMWALACGFLGLAACAVVWFFDRTQFFRSYLVGYSVWWTVSMGCLGMTMLGHLVAGRWAWVARPFFESGIAAIPLLAIAWLPFVLGLEALYPWAVPKTVAADPMLQHRAGWMNAEFFFGRTAFYFTTWLLLGFALWRWSNIPREGAERVEAFEGVPVDPRSPRRLRLGSALGLILFMTTVTFASFDWLMSLDAHWYSTAFGAIIALGGAVAALALAAGMMACLRTWPAVAGLSPEKLRNDLGSLLLAFVMLWAYLSFSQYLIIWSADQPSEITWYLERVSGVWGALAIGLIALHFALPFLALLSRDVKRDPRWLGSIAGLLLVMHVADLYWQIVPAYSHDSIRIHWGDAAAIVGVGGLWSFVFLWHLRRRLPPVLDALARAERNGCEHDQEAEAAHA